MGTAAPAMTPTEDLEAAIAELPAKKDVLREAFHSLAACSPHPLPFTWEDLDAHVSAVQSSISRRFSQLRALEAARPARASKNKEGDNEVGEEEEVEEEEEQEEVVEEEEVEEVEEEEEEEEVVEEEEEKEEEEVEEELEEVVEEEEEEEEVEEVEEEEEEEEVVEEEEEDEEEVEEEEEVDIGEDNKRDADVEAVTTKVSAGQGKEAGGEEELDGYAQWDGEDQDTEEEEMVEKMTNKHHRGRRGLPAVGRKEFAEACARMDAGTLVEFVLCFSINRELLFALYHAPDPSALVLQVVKPLLYSKDLKRSTVWGKCVRLFCWLSMNSIKPSADTTEQAKLVAKDWKEMIGRPECCGQLELLARSLLQFLISYNIVSEFNIHEIISIFAMVPRKGLQKNKRNADNAKLCEDLGLADRATDLIDYMVGNGQHLEVFHVLQFLNLEDKYPPFPLLKRCIEKAKQTSVDLFRKNEAHKSLNLAIPKEIWIAKQLAEKKLTDSRQRSAILAEIRYLIGAYKRNKGQEIPQCPQHVHSISQGIVKRGTKSAGKRSWSTMRHKSTSSCRHRTKTS